TRRSLARSSTPRTPACPCSVSATASKCSPRRTFCPAASCATITALSSAWTNEFETGAEIVIPLKNGEGGFIASTEELARLEGEGQVVFRYVGVNPNG